MDDEVVPPRKSKKKAKGKTRARDQEVWWNPSGVFHEVQCLLCVHRNLECEINVAEGACVPCCCSHQHCNIGKKKRERAAKHSPLVDALVSALSQCLEPIQNGVDEMFFIIDDVYSALAVRNDEPDTMLKAMSRRLCRMEESISVLRPANEFDPTPFTNSNIIELMDDEEEFEDGVRETLRLKQEVVDQLLVNEPRPHGNDVGIDEAQGEELGGPQNQIGAGTCVDKLMDIDADAEGSTAPGSSRGTISPLLQPPIPAIQVIPATPQNSQEAAVASKDMRQIVAAANARRALLLPIGGATSDEPQLPSQSQP